MFMYFFLLLYHGVRFDKREQDLMPWRAKLTYWLDASPSVDTGWTFTEGGAEAGPLGLVVGFLRDLLVSIILTVLLAVVLWLSLNVFVTAVVLLGTPLRTLVPCGSAAQRCWLLSLRGPRWGVVFLVCCAPFHEFPVSFFGSSLTLHLLLDEKRRRLSPFHDHSLLHVILCRDCRSTPPRPLVSLCSIRPRQRVFWHGRSSAEGSGDSACPPGAAC